jgi:HAD superfamily hydrolase (TIGR01459 family)
MIEGLSEVVGRYEGVIFDLWGVLHDGRIAFPAARECLCNLKAINKTVALLSNSPRRSDIVAKRLESLGLTRDLYDYLHTSGEEVFLQLRDRSDEFHRNLGASCIDTSNGRFDGLLDGTGIEVVHSIDDASFVCASGPEDGLAPIAEYNARLADCARRGLPLLCVNPDYHVIEGGQLHLCAGAIARRYAELGGTVRYYGKPHPLVYERCLAAIAEHGHCNVLVIGDNLETDIRGGRQSALDTLLILGGIHSLEIHDINSREQRSILFQKYQECPHYCLPFARW